MALRFENEGEFRNFIDAQKVAWWQAEKEDLLDIEPKPIIPESPMNKTESRFADYLEQLKHMKEIIAWRFEPIKFILAQNVKGGRNATTYKPDFLVVRPDCFEFMEVKAKSGNWTSVRDDALVKIKVVSEMFLWFRFTLAYYEKGEWTFKRV